MDVYFVYLYASILSKFNVIILNAEIIFMTSKAFRLKYLQFHFKCSNLGKKKQTTPSEMKKAYYSPMAFYFSPSDCHLTTISSCLF